MTHQTYLLLRRSFAVKQAGDFMRRPYCPILTVPTTEWKSVGVSWMKRS